MRPLVLIILDGWGYSRESYSNPMVKAHIPTFHTLEQRYPLVLLEASGAAVGLPWGEMGNSEVGHLTLGAGRIIVQPLIEINEAIDHGAFIKNDALSSAVNHIQQRGGRFHLAGLLTSGSVHASFRHLLALLDFVKAQNLSNVFLHLFTDGKDSKPQEALTLVEKLEEYIRQYSVSAKIATVIGRNFAMDRDGNWNLTQEAFELLTKGEGMQAGTVHEALSHYYQSGIHDDAIPPTIVGNDQSNAVRDKDALVFFNFREDSMRQLMKTFVDSKFSQFQRINPGNLFIATMVPYSAAFQVPTLFPRRAISSSLAEMVSRQDLKQLHIAETEKYAHVTYFFNGLHEQPFTGEDDISIPSLKNPAENPQMRASEIADKIIEFLPQNIYQFTVVNFANPDMLAHTGNFEATVKGVEAVDAALGRVLEAAKQSEAQIIITADHGNAENLAYVGSGEIETRHNINPVPCFLVAKEFERNKTPEQLQTERAESRGVLADVAPTILELLGLSVPPEMTGQSLLRML